MSDWGENPEIEIYSDGGADPNPGKGGYGLILSWKGHKKEFYEGFALTTNNRMELLGVITGLKKLKTKSKVTIYTDSKYVIDGIELGWAKKWRENNWLRNKKEKAINPDLWEELLNLISEHLVTFKWVKGHSGHPENERCDYLATIAMKLDNLKIDEGYEAFLNEPKTNLKIENVGDKCRKCNTDVIKKVPKKRKVKQDQSYYYEYYLLCPSCNTMYMVDSAKKNISEENENSLF